MLKEKLEEIFLNVQKPARYTGGELNSVIKNKNLDIRFAFCFPDLYEVGMSHLGLKILYNIINNLDYAWCERVFAPWEDFEKELINADIPLYGLESMDPLYEFDIIGFTLQYELSYSNIINMLHLGMIPVFSKDRTELKNLVIAGGPCTCNPEPLSDFIDIFVIGEGEEVTIELLELYREAKLSGISKIEFLKKAGKIEGVYVPSLYSVYYNPDGTLEKIEAQCEMPAKIRKRIIKNLDAAVYPEMFIVPFIETVHDRIILEVMRGCYRGCRFCQAGFIYRPLREKDPDTLCGQAENLCETSGYDEISLSSLSTGDYSKIEILLNKVIGYTDSNKINLSLPSMRIDNFSKELLDKITSIRKSGLTFAPEAGTQRLRNVINKNVTEEDIFKTCGIAFSGGQSGVKLYFMIGLPTETFEDIEGIAGLAQKIVDLYYSLSLRNKGKFNVTVSVSTFVPKPCTPFQWESQDTEEIIIKKQNFLKSSIKSKKISCNSHDAKTSVLEGVFARGDRKLGQVIYKAWQKGCRFDGWTEHFKFEKWIEALDECGLDINFYAGRNRNYDEVLPWDHIDYGIKKEFLIKENEKAKKGETTDYCMKKCSGCGIGSFAGGGMCC